MGNVPRNALSKLELILANFLLTLREEEVEKILSKLKPKEAIQIWGYYLENEILL